MFLLNSSTYPIGLDISDLSLKLIQLNKIRDKVTVQAVSKIDLPAGFFENGIIKNKEGIASAIRELINKPRFGKISTDDVVACLPESRTFVKIIDVEKTPNNIKDVIEVEIEKHIPMPIEDLYYDWQIIKNYPNKQSIMIGAAPRKIVDEYIDLLSSARLSIVALEIEPISICRALLAEEGEQNKQPSNKNYGILDIGSTHTSLTVYSSGAVLFTVSIPISGTEITEKISESLKIDYQQAERAKIICGFDENKAQGIVKKILNDMIEKMIEKIKESIDFYNMHFSAYGPVDELIICGGGANIENINEIIEKEIKVKTLSGDPLINIRKEEKEKLSNILMEKHDLDINLSNKKNGDEKNSVTQDVSLTFVTAIGLALREIFIDKI